jgi:hypothetical protein
LQVGEHSCRLFFILHPQKEAAGIWESFSLNRNLSYLEINNYKCQEEIKKLDKDSRREIVLFEWKIMIINYI